MTEEILKTRIMHEVFFNPNSINKDSKANMYFMNEEEIDGYLEDFNSKFGTNYKSEEMIRSVKEKKTYPGLIEKNEYKESKEYLNDFCNVNDKIPQLKKNYKSQSRLLLFNINSFLRSCLNYKRNIYGIFEKNNDVMVSFSNLEDIISLCQQLEPEILAFQEYSPIFTQEKNQVLKLSNFTEYYNEKIDKKLPNILVGNGKSKKEIIKSPTFTGNLIMSIYPIEEKFILSFSNETNVCFIGYMTTIEGKTVIIFNIYPSKSKENLKRNQDFIDPNFDQIKTFIDTLVMKFPPEKNNIIVCGDFNNYSQELKEYMFKKLFRSVHDFYSINPNQFTSYYGVYQDLIFVSMNFLYDFSILGCHIIPVGFSDHYPIVFDFCLNQNKYQESLDFLYKQYASQNLNVVFNYKIYGRKEFRISDKELMDKIRYGVKEFINLKKMEELLGINSVIIPKGTFLVHGTDGDYFEVQKFEKNPDDNLNLPLSCTFLHCPLESFMSWFGLDTEITKKRFLIFKVKRDFKVLNLYNKFDSLEGKLNFRRECYIKLYNYFKDRLNLPTIDFSSKNDTFTFKVMRFLWLIFMDQLLNNINEITGNYVDYNFYGFLLCDAALVDAATFKENVNLTFGVSKKDTYMGGLEVQVFLPDFFLEIDSVYYDKHFYKISTWIKNLENIKSKIEEEEIKARKLFTNLNLDYRDPKARKLIPNYIKYKIIRRNLVNIHFFIIGLLCNYKYFNQDINQRMTFLLLLILNSDDITVHINEPFIANLLLNEFLKYFINVKYFYPSSMRVPPYNPSDFNNLKVFTPEKDFKELYKSFAKFALDDYNSNKSFSPQILEFMEKNTIVNRDKLEYQYNSVRDYINGLKSYVSRFNSTRQQKEPIDFIPKFTAQV